MKKYSAIILILLLTSLTVKSQSRGIRIGYIDMEYILQNVPDYTEAKNQLEQKAQRWKQDIEIKKNEINKLKENLKTERALLTKELLEEREDEIKHLETELLDYQQNRFGPMGDLITQKTVLVKPIQDQVFTIIQDIAEAKKYDFIFDKSSDLTMLFAAKRHDISDQVIRFINRTEKREQLNKKQLKEQATKEYNEDLEDENPVLAERRKALEEKKAAREKLIEERKAEREKQLKEREEKRKEALSEKEAEKSGTIIDKTKTENKSSTNENELTPEEKRAKLAEERARVLEERRKAAEERRQKILEEREAAKKAREKKD